MSARAWTVTRVQWSESPAARAGRTAPAGRGLTELGFPRRAAVGQAMVDQSWAMANRGDGRFDAAFMVGATLPAYPLGWAARSWEPSPAS